MSNQTLPLNGRLQKYMIDFSLREPKILRRLREETSQHRLANMQIAPEQGQFMAMIAQLIEAKRYLEIGTFTGYSSIVMAFSMPKNSEIICCDISEEFTSIAKRYWEESGLLDQIKLHLRPAEETLTELIEKGRENQFDIIFIDADKKNYDQYYELSLRLIRKGGLIMIDNVLWGGDVSDPTINDTQTRSIRAVNKKIRSDQRINHSLVPIGDGMTLARKL